MGPRRQRGGFRQASARRRSARPPCQRRWCARRGTATIQLSSRTGRGQPAESSPATLQTALITGANSGLGLACARALIDRGWHVVLAVRDPGKGLEAARWLGAPDSTTVMELDLASLRSVQAFVAEYSQRREPAPTRALICNAGLQVPTGTRFTSDGFELTFGTNHLGHFALVQGLVDQLGAPARVLLVSSDTHDPRKHTGMPAPSYVSAQALAHPDASSSAMPGRQRYTTSKLCNVLFAYELARRLRASGPSGVTVNAFNPGLMPGSGLAREYSALQRFGWRFVMPLMRVLPSVRSTPQSGRHLAALAADEAYAGVTGGYFDGLKPIESSGDSHDLAKARDLWDTSEQLIAAAGAGR